MHCSTMRFVALTIILLAACLSATAQDRAAIPADYKWKTEQIYATVKDWEKDMEAIRADMDQIAAFKGKFAGKEATNPVQSLIEYNKLNEQMEIKFEHADDYVSYNFDVDMGNSDWTGRSQQVEDLGTQIRQKLSWQEPELLQIPRDTLMKWVDSHKELQPYRKTYEDMYALAKHTLSAPQEEILALAGNITSTSAEVYGKLSDVDMNFGTIKDEKGDTVRASYEAWVSYSTSKDRRVREDMFKAVWSQFKAFENTLSALMTGTIKKDIFMTKARKYDNTLQHALDQTFVPSEVYTNLVSTTKENLTPLHKYEAIRKRMLGVDHYRHWDYYVNLTPGEEKRYTYEQGLAIVQDAVKPLGPQYVKDITQALTPKNGWVDVYANKGKHGGAYSGGTYGIHPFMLFNFDIKKGLTLDDVSAMAHEVGHSMHSSYSQRNQPYANHQYAIFNAEVASTTNETLLAMKLLDEARKAHKTARGKDKAAAKEHLVNLLVQNIDAGRGTFFRQVMFAAWELEAHKLGEAGKPMTAESFNKLYADLLKDYQGPALEYTDLSDVSWAQVPHFYRGYYVYTYATSYAAAVALAQKIRGEYLGDKHCKGATEHYLTYLKSGSSKHPVELLKDAGVDMTTPAPIVSFIKYWSGLVNELDALTK